MSTKQLKQGALLLFLGSTLSCGQDEAQREQPTQATSELDQDQQTTTDMDADQDPERRFSAQADTLFVELEQAPRRCYTLVPLAQVECALDASSWDLMFEVQGRSWSIWSNGGVYGTGQGAAFGPLQTNEAATILTPDDVPGMFADQRGAAMLSTPWYSYNVFGGHDITANQRLYVIETPQARYRLQLRSYYDQDGVSAKLQARYAPWATPEQHKDLEIDARAGGFGAPLSHPLNKYTYLDLDSGQLVELSDAEARQDGQSWDIGFKRFSVITNSGVSGKGTVSSALGAEHEALYDEQGTAKTQAFAALSQESADRLFMSSLQGDELKWEQDQGRPALINDGGEQSWFGFTFEAGSPKFFSRPNNWWVVRSADGASMAKLHVTEVELTPRRFTVELHLWSSEKR